MKLLSQDHLKIKAIQEMFITNILFREIFQSLLNSSERDEAGGTTKRWS